MTDAAAPDRTLISIQPMPITTVLFVCVTGIVRHLGSDIPAVEAAFIRYGLGLILVLPAFRPLIGNWPSGVMMRRFVLRGLVHGVAVMLWFYAMARIPIAEVTALGYTAPIFVTLGAAFFFRETLHLRRIVAVAIGFLGAMIIIRPGFQEISTGQLAQLTAAPLFACSFLLAKGLTRDFGSGLIVAMLSLGCTLTLLPGAILQWRDPTLEEVAWLGLTAVFATAGHYTLTRAFQAAPLTVTQPVGFLQLVWAALLGVLVFGEPLDPYVFLGGGMVVAAATYISHREAQAARRMRTPPAVATKT
ncbi:MAG TPA: EamA family transporter [Thermohalobaculum sp.]|nr:EamA family transporter [Thermohalobaculum sp.]